MNRVVLRRLVRGGLMACGAVASLSVGAVVVGSRVLDDDPNGTAVNALMNGFRFYADGLSARYIDQANQGIRPATEQNWQAFEQRMTDSTFVTLFYTYRGADGVSRSRTYYAMSGSRGSVDSGPESLLTSDLPDWLEPWPGEVMATIQDDGNTRVPWHMPAPRPEATWDLQDAEIKAVRTLEKDLNDHVVDKGGFATVFVSRPICLACSQALSNFANAYELSLVANENLATGSQTNHLFRARRAAYLTTVRSSLIGRERFRPAQAPPIRGRAPAMCVAGRPVIAFPLAIRRPTHSALVTLIRAYAQLDGNASYVLSGTDESYAAWVLAEPSSPYSSQAERDLQALNDAVRLAAKMLTVAGHVPSQREISQRKQRELGFTKSRPWTDVADFYGFPINSYPGVPSHTKADIDADIVIAVRDMVGNDYPAIGAMYAVAAQLLRDKLSNTPVAEQKRIGLRPDVLNGMSSTPRQWRPSEFDRQYLAILLDGAVRDWDIDAPRNPLLPRLSVPLRVARMAAAYRDQQPFDVQPCLTPRQRNPFTAGKGGDDSRPLCFNDATDRAVYAWFVRQLRREMTEKRRSETGDPHWQNITRPFRYTQFGEHALADGSLDAVIRKEVVEMKIVNRLVADGDLSYEASLPVIRRAVNLLNPEKH
ncbi:MAG TPA: hypothetical protein VM621_06655 [Luteibacter sp.]|uniref:hypothetical protein n=1 Tax=Luteibacter sp. TaxID=1886636 RepID=UPI002C018F33|nr:hypothetical protein [Luteibacter sp.]HVI54716.1 hypothetical protein [Luteibacter sp.]